MAHQSYTGQSHLTGNSVGSLPISLPEPATGPVRGRENAGAHASFFTADWLREWQGIFQPITS